MRPERGWAVRAPGGPLEPWRFERREVLAEDVAVRITHCGVCGSDLSAQRSPQVGSSGPLVLGHEIAGTVTEVGAQVTRLAVGDDVLVGTIVDSCRACPPCLAREESYCLQGVTTTYGGRDRHDGRTTQGGFSTGCVVDQRFVYRLPDGLEAAAAAPLMCAGATTWSPLMHWQAGPRTSVGVVGLGGLGHMAIKWAHALGAETVLFTTSADKAEEGYRLGADDVVLARDDAAMAASANRLDLVLDTASGSHPLDPYLRTLRLDGVMCRLGISGADVQVDQMSLLLGRRSLASSGVCGTADTQRMLDFAGRHGITADVEVLDVNQVDTALERLARNDAHHRLVLQLPTDR